MVSVIVHASQSKLHEIGTATLEDSELQSFIHYNLNGWPQKKHDVHVLTNSYSTVSQNCILKMVSFVEDRN